MSIRVECDECRKKYRISDDRAGEWIRCHECGADIEVPEDDWDDDDWGRGDWDDEPHRHRSQGRRSRRHEPEDEGLSPAVKRAIFGGLFALTLIITLVVMLSGGGADPPQPAGNNDQRLADNDRRNPQLQGNSPAQPGVVNTNPQPGIRPPSVPGQMKTAPETANPGPPPAVNATNWQVTVDPAPQPEVDPDAEPVAEVDNSEPISITFPEDSRGGDALVMPTRPTGLIVLGENDSESGMREFWNARTGKRVGMMTGLKFHPHRQAVSPSGAFYAATTYISPGVLVWDVSRQKALGELPLTADGKRPSDTFLALPGDDRIVAIVQEKRGTDYVTRVNVWSLPSGDPLKSFEIAGRCAEEVFTFSPGGRFLSTRLSDSKAAVTFYDLTSGTPVGEISGPARSKHDDSPAEVKAAAFSVDGSQLALMFRGSNYQVVTYDVASGQVRHQIAIERDLAFRGSRDSPQIQWFPDGKMLFLFGCSIASVESESIVHTFPKAKRDPGGGTWVTGNEQVGVRTGDSRNSAFTLISVDAEAIAGQKERIALGETADDAGLPPLSSSSGLQAKTISSQQPASGWTLAADPSPGLNNSLLQNPFQVPVSSRLGVGNGLFFVASESPRAVLQCGVDRRPDSDIAPVLEILDLANGERTGSMPLHFACAALAISPDGKRVITRGQNSPSRLDVWDLDTRQHIIGWKPKFTGWPDSKNASDRQDPLARVRGIDKAVSADFVNSDHVLTVFNEATILWKLPELTAVYVLPLVRTSVLSPGRKYLLHGGDRSQSDIMAHHSLTGEPLGRLAVGGPVSGFSVSAAGDRIAVRGYQELIALDWKTGTVQTRFKLPFFTERLAWTDDRFLISSDGRVVDLQEQLIVWRYLTNGGAAAETVPDNRSWLAVSSGQNTGTVTVSAIRLPDQQVRNALADMDLKPKMLMEPGSVVSVEANVSGHPPGQSDYQAVVVEKVTKALTNAGHKVQNGGSFRAVISLTHKLTDEKMQFTTEALGRFGISRPNSGSVIEVPVERVSFGVKLLGAGGKELWSGSQGGTSNEVGRFAEFRLKKGESLQKILVRGMWSSVDSTLRSIAFPSRIFDPSMSSGFGTSMIVNGQPVIQSQ